jgi:hypothetical protein
MIANNSATSTLYVGVIGVTSANGIPLLPYEKMNFDASMGLQVYGICAAGLTADVRVIEIDNG